MTAAAAEAAVVDAVPAATTSSRASGRAAQAARHELNDARDAAGFSGRFTFNSPIRVSLTAQKRLILGDAGADHPV